MPSERIAIVDDEPVISKLLEYKVGRDWGYRVSVYSSATPFLESLAEGAPDLVLLDLMLPDISGEEVLRRIKNNIPELPVIILSAQGRIEVALETIKLGASDYFSKPVDFPKLEIAIRNALQIGALTKEVSRLREGAELRVHFENIVAQSGEMQEVFRLVHKVKDSDICVLVLGESGTGKELIARAIHYNSKRRAGPFVVVNSASIPHELLESELFGHERGAFTGATQRRIGKFEFARGGSIFLDEIGEMDPTLQAKILRVLQEKQFERVGGNETVVTDARMIFATNRDLWGEVNAKRFREDLYYRLSAFPIVLPPLRQRKSDILLLAEHFLRAIGPELGKPDLRFSRSALELMYAYPWPGNIREMENAIRRAIVLTETQVLTEKEMPLAMQSFAATDTPMTPVEMTERNDTVLPLERLKEKAIRGALKNTKGNIVEAASALGISRATLYRLARKYKILLASEEEGDAAEESEE